VALQKSSIKPLVLLPRLCITFAQYHYNFCGEGSPVKSPIVHRLHYSPIRGGFRETRVRSDSSDPGSDPLNVDGSLDGLEVAHTSIVPSSDATAIAMAISPPLVHATVSRNRDGEIQFWGNNGSVCRSLPFWWSHI
jgi:hypothetical protein